MNQKLILNIAKSLLMARWRQTLVAAIGVTFGITMFIALLSFMTGLNKLLDGLVLNRTPHIRLFNEIRPNIHQPVNESNRYRGHYNFISSLKSGNARLAIYNSGFIMQSLKKDERVLGFTPKITAQVFFNYGTLNINGVVNGIDAEEENRLFFFNDYIVEGKSANLTNVSNSIILGIGLAERMRVNNGDMITITTVTGDRYSLKVAGFFQSGINEFDKVQSYASISTTQKILGKSNDYITDIAVKLKNLNDAPAIAKEYKQLYNTEAEDIQTANSQFETGSRVRFIISYAVGITLLIVAGFGIYNILNMMIYEKMDSIAILKATGFSGRDVNNIFMAIALGIGFLGGLVGLLCGFLLSKGIDHIPFTTTALPTIKTYPINYDPVFYLIGISFSLLTTWMAGFFP
ncbi:MAG: FtsX-like permease family protein, partial [Bacteroidota bacterium]